MAPTRELAKQVSDTFKMFAAADLSVLSVYGGTAIYPQGETSQLLITTATATSTIASAAMFCCGKKRPSLE